MRLPHTTAAARFNERRRRPQQPPSKKKPAVVASPATEQYGGQNIFFQRADKKQQQNLDQIMELVDEEDGESLKSTISTTILVDNAHDSPFAASPSAVIFSDGENPFRTRKGTSNNCSSNGSSPNQVLHFDSSNGSCLFQPELSSLLPPPKNLFPTSTTGTSREGMDSQGKCNEHLPSLERRTTIPHDEEDFQDAIQDSHMQPQPCAPPPPMHPADEVEENFLNASQELPPDSEDASPKDPITMTTTKVSVVKNIVASNDDDAYSNSVAEVDNIKTTAADSAAEKKAESFYDWSSVKSTLLQSFRSNSAYLQDKILECHQPSRVDDDMGDSISPLFGGSTNDAEASLASGYDSIRRSFSSFSMGELPTPTNLFGDYTKSSTEAKSNADDKVNHIRTTTGNDGVAQAPTKGQNDKFALQDESAAKVILYIDHYGPSTFFRLMKDLKHNKRVKELHIFRSWNKNIKRSRNKADICILFDAIRTLPSIGYLALSNFLPEELDMVTTTQWHNPYLTSLRLHVCQGGLSKNLLKTLAGIPKLSDLALEVSQSCPFHHVLKNERLQTVLLAGNDFVWKHEHIMELVYVLRKTSTLKRLSLEAFMAAKTFKFLAYGLNGNAGVEDLRVNVLPGETSVETNEAIQELSRTLTINASLKSIWNTNYDALKANDKVSKRLLDAFAKNDTIQDFLLFEEEPAFHCAKEALLKDNRQNSVPILPDFYVPGCATVESLRQLATTKDPHNDNLSLVESVAVDYAAMGSSITRLGSGMMDFGKGLFGIVLETAASIGTATVSKAPPTACDVDSTSVDAYTSGGIDLSFSESTVSSTAA